MTDSPTVAATPWGRRLLRALVDGAFALIVRRRVIGMENVPAEGGCVLVSNHLSNFDAPLLFSILRRPGVTALFATEYRENLVSRLFIEAIGGIWIERRRNDGPAIDGSRAPSEPLEQREDLREALRRLEHGWLVGVAPEGRRSRSGALITGRRGAAFLAMRTRMPIVPVALASSETIAPSVKRLRRATVTIRFGPMIVPPPLEPGDEKRQLQAVTDEYMTRLASLLPPEYRGVYGPEGG